MSARRREEDRGRGRAAKIHAVIVAKQRRDGDERRHADHARPTSVCASHAHITIGPARTAGPWDTRTGAGTAPHVSTSRSPPRATIQTAGEPQSAASAAGDAERRRDVSSASANSVCPNTHLRRGGRRRTSAVCPDRRSPASAIRRPSSICCAAARYSCSSLGKLAVARNR